MRAKKAKSKLSSGQERGPLSFVLRICARARRELALDSVFGASRIPYFPNAHARGSSRAASSALEIAGACVSAGFAAAVAPCCVDSLKPLLIENAKAYEGRQITGSFLGFAVITGPNGSGSPSLTWNTRNLRALLRFSPDPLWKPDGAGRTSLANWVLIHSLPNN